MNAHAQIFVPIAVQLEHLFKTPFFQQRLEKFMYKQFRTESINMHDFTILASGSDVANILTTTKSMVVFLASYMGHAIVYEANRVDDPRTGYFRLLIQPILFKP